MSGLSPGERIQNFKPQDPLALWNDYRRRPVRVVIGLMSGTSLDAIDVAWVRFKADQRLPELLGWREVEWSAHDREFLMRVARSQGDTESVARAHWLVGRRFAEVAASCCDDWVCQPDAAGSHGQTVAHFPESTDLLPAATLQIGAAAPIAQALGCPVVHDFRAADFALGGQGAPLVPAVDALLFRSDISDRVLLNLGGVANATWLPRGTGLDGVSGFDTGPGNLLLDQAAVWASAGEFGCDRDGVRASRGKVDVDILERLLRLPMLARRPPRSYGREDFGELLFGEILTWRDWNRAPDDLLATLTRFTVRATVDALRNWTPCQNCELFVAGGGANNPAVMRSFSEEWSPGRVGLQSELGIPVDAKEAVAFAVLADATLRGVACGLPGVTGAVRPSILGSVAFP
jgi:anhydro-N-acetylmuramic acid kinase